MHFNFKVVTLCKISSYRVRDVSRLFIKFLRVSLVSRSVPKYFKGVSLLDQGMCVLCIEICVSVFIRPNAYIFDCVLVVFNYPIV